MKKLVLTLFVALATITNIFAQSFEAECPSGQMLKFHVIDQENHYVAISSHQEVQGHLILPETVSYQGQEFTVTEIESDAFYQCHDIVGSLTIPNTITAIQYEAFAYCDGIEELTIGEAVESISDFAFYYCDNISIVNFNAINCVTQRYWISTRENGTELHIGPNVQRLNYEVFSYCYYFNGQIDLPESLTYIGDRAFEYCQNITGSINIGDNVTYIGEEAFFSCKGLSGALSIGNSVSSIGDRAFGSCNNLTGPLSLGENVTSIGEYTFHGCSNLTGSLNFGNHLCSIGKGAFENCTSISGPIELPNSLDSIGDYALGHCAISGNLTIPANVISIGVNPFYGCNDIDAINVEAANPNYYSEGNTIIERSSKKLISGIKSSQIPDDVKTIGNAAFSNCTGLTEVTFGSELTEIEKNAFYNCTHLTNIYSNAVVPPIVNQQAFYNVPTYLTMTVPCGSFDAYWNDNTWSMFNNIIELGNFDVKVISSNIAYGNAQLTQAPSCENGGQTIVTATAQPGYKFDSWTVDGMVVSRESTYTFTAHEDLIIIASFIPETGVEENNLGCIDIYPNPVLDVLHIDGKDLVRIEIVNSIGQILETFTCDKEETTIDMSQYQPGLYLIRMIGEGSASKQIIKL